MLTKNQGPAWTIMQKDKFTLYNSVSAIWEVFSPDVIYSISKI